MLSFFLSVALATQIAIKIEEAEVIEFQLTNSSILAEAHTASEPAVLEMFRENSWSRPSEDDVIDEGRVSETTVDVQRISNTDLYIRHLLVIAIMASASSLVAGLYGSTTASIILASLSLVVFTGLVRMRLGRPIRSC